MIVREVTYNTRDAAEWVPVKRLMIVTWTISRLFITTIGKEYEEKYQSHVNKVQSGVFTADDMTAYIELLYKLNDAMVVASQSSVVGHRDPVQMRLCSCYAALAPLCTHNIEIIEQCWAKIKLDKQITHLEGFNGGDIQP